MDGRYESIYQRGHKPGKPEQADTTSQPEAQSKPVEVAPVTASGERVTAEDEAGNPPTAASSTGGRNPYIRWLVITAIVLIVVGVGAVLLGGHLINMRMMPSSVQDQQEAFLLLTYGQTLTTLAPFLMALGIGTLIGVGFLRAHGWQVTNRPAEGRK